MAGSADPLARNPGRLPPRVGLVSPLPPQVGGVASVAEWLLDHEDDLGVRYEAFDLERPGGAVGGGWSASAAARQIALLRRFAAWLVGAPPILHFCVSCTTTGLMRDVALLAAARAARRVSVVHVHGSDLAGALRSPVRRRALRLAAGLSAERVALSPALAASLASIGVRARWIPNPVRIVPTRMPQRNGNDPLRLLLVGRFGERKGCFELVDALARAREGGVDVMLTVVGREEREGEEARLRRFIDQRSVTARVEFAGAVPREGLDRWYGAADVLCLPSRREGLPMAVLEGMAYGLPVLATTVGGIPDLVEHEQSGFLVEPGDVRSLAERIGALADPDLRRRMGRAARERVAEFASTESIIERWRALYAAVAPAEDR